MNHPSKRQFAVASQEFNVLTDEPETLSAQVIQGLIDGLVEENKPGIGNVQSVLITGIGRGKLDSATWLVTVVMAFDYYPG